MGRTACTGVHFTFNFSHLVNVRYASKILVLETEDLGFEAGIFPPIFPSLTSVSKVDVMLSVSSLHCIVMKCQSEFFGTEAYERQPVR